MLQNGAHEFWFIVGSQDIYGQETLNQVRDNSLQIVHDLNKCPSLSHPIVFKGVMATSEDIIKLIKEVNYNDNVVGIIAWMHTFSPAKMWVQGIKMLQKPLLHFVTQFNREIPWETLDMDYMNLHQSAHGDREFGFINARLKINNKVIVGHWSSKKTKKEMSAWMKVAIGAYASKNVRVARFGDNMRHVAVTEGDKIEAAIQFGWTVDYFGIGDLAEQILQVNGDEVESTFKYYKSIYMFDYTHNTKSLFEESVKEQIKIEIALRNFLQSGGYTAFTTNFEDLHGMKQLPGMAVQRLNMEGYGFAGEGDWKTAALNRVMKVMANNESTGFMEDYTYNLVEGDEYILQSHMLEVDPTLAKTKPRVIVSPLAISNKEDPARLVFDGKSGEGVVASMIDEGTQFKLLINKVMALDIIEPAPNLPVSRIIWRPYPNFYEGVTRWIESGGGHHTVVSLELSVQQIVDWAKMMGLEYVVIE